MHHCRRHRIARRDRSYGSARTRQRRRQCSSERGGCQCTGFGRSAPVESAGGALFGSRRGVAVCRRLSPCAGASVSAVDHVSSPPLVSRVENGRADSAGSSGCTIAFALGLSPAPAIKFPASALAKSTRRVSSRLSSTPSLASSSGSLLHAANSSHRRRRQSSIRPFRSWANRADST